MATTTTSARTGLKSTLITNLNATVQEIKATGGCIYAVHAFNPGAAQGVVKFFNARGTAVVVGTTAAQHRLIVAADDATNDGQLLITPFAKPHEGCPLFDFTDAISVCVVQELADSGSTAPASDLTIEILWI